MADLKYWVWFSMAAEKHRLAAGALLEQMGQDPEEVFRLAKSDLEQMGIREEELLESLCDKNLKRAEKEIYIADKHRIKLIPRDGEDYPDSLSNIDDSPFLLYTRGAQQEFDEGLYLALVGTRKASQYGLKVAKQLAYELAKRGVTIVSGMATGIDGAAHEGALEAGGRTIAVLGCGVNLVYPKDHETLMLEIMKNGMVLSEFSFDTPPLRWNFPQRNRIISGLCRGVIVAEAEEVSGSLITANLALEQGRDVFAIPGDILSPASVGTNNLIRSGGAKFTICVQDILDEYLEEFCDTLEEEAPGPVPAAEQTAPEPSVPSRTEARGEEISAEKLILEAVRTDPLGIDEICGKTGLPMQSVNTALTMMELAGLVEVLPGKTYIKTSKLRMK